MCLRSGLVATLVAPVLSVSVQSNSFAGAASHEATLHGHVGIVGHHHIKQPDPPKQSIPTVNVRDFGATGNGVTDDTAAIQNAIAAAQGNNEGVLFPAGTYLHTSIIYDNGVSLIGVGGASTLLANNPNATAVVLTGVSPSIQNLVVNSVPASTGSFDTMPFHTTLLVQNAQNFVVQGITIVQGTGRVGTYLQQSAVGNVSGVTFNGTGGLSDFGIIVDGCANVSLVGNLLLNEVEPITVGGFSNFLCNSIAVIGNSMSTSVAGSVGIFASAVEVMDVSQNQIQLTSSSAGVPLNVIAGNSNLIAQNIISGGVAGLVFVSQGSSNEVSQNIIRNCGQVGAEIITLAGTGNVAFLSNQFGECGTTTAGEAILLQPGVGPNDITVFNNVYQGHANNLADFIKSSGHLNFVSGNTQTQTNLPNSIP